MKKIVITFLLGLTWFSIILVVAAFFHYITKYYPEQIGFIGLFCFLIGIIYGLGCIAYYNFFGEK